MGRLTKLVAREAAPAEEHRPEPAAAEDRKRLRQRQLLDPRPDLTEDHRDWVAVLAAARQDSELHGLLHGLRCGGARLEVRVTSQGRPYYKLDYSTLLSVWKEDELRRRWLEPMRARIKAALDRGLHIKTDVEREMAVQSTRAAVG